MKDKITEFYDNFNIDVFQNFLQDMDLLSLLSHPAVVSVCIVLGLLSIYRQWRLIIITFLSYTFLYGYLFVTFVIVKNSELSSLATFSLFFFTIFLLAGLGFYKHLKDRGQERVVSVISHGL